MSNRPLPIRHHPGCRRLPGANLAAPMLTILLTFFLAIPPVSMATDGLEQQQALKILRQATDFFHQANQLAATDKSAAAPLYRKALRRYQQLVAGGITNGKLYSNIANTYYQLGDLGHAVLNYRRAQQYLPDDPVLAQNIATVLAQRRDRIEIRQQEKILQTLFFWHYDLPFAVKAPVFAVFYLTAWLLFALWLWRRRPALLGWGGAALLVALLFCGSLLVDRKAYADRRPGVITADQTVARKGDGLTYQPAFTDPLHAGTEFILKEKRGQWLHIVLEDGRSCWIVADDAAMVRAEAGATN